MKKKYFYVACLLCLMISCKEKAAEKEEELKEEAQTPVTVTTVDYSPLTEYVELNATSSYLQSNFIKAPANGYIKAVYLKPGQNVRAGQLAFILKTKEAEALGNTINKLDTSFHFSGVIPIRAAAGGYIQELSHQAGDYVQDGDQLAVLTDEKGFGFILNVPYELRRYIQIGKSVQLDLPDSTHLTGTVASMMPSVDSISQSQSVLIKLPPGKMIPQNLIAKVRIIKMDKENAASLPRQAVLSDETQTSFWVMKMIDSVTAVKVPITKGIETGSRIEILNPRFGRGDQIVLTGNYGLADTAHVKIAVQEE